MENTIKINLLALSTEDIESLHEMLLDNAGYTNDEANVLALHTLERHMVQINMIEPDELSDEDFDFGEKVPCDDLRVLHTFAECDNPEDSTYVDLLEVYEEDIISIGEPIVYDDWETGVSKLVYKENGEQIETYFIDHLKVLTPKI